MTVNLNILLFISLFFLIIAFTAAQDNYRNQQKSSSKRSQQNGEPIEQGRTLGLIRPLLGLGLSSIRRPLLGYDVPLPPSLSNRPSTGTGSSQSDPYYGYANYGGYVPNYSSAYNYYGGYPFYRPILPYYNVYRPQVYPGYYGGSPQYNGYGSQRPLYSNSRPRPVAQRPIVGQQAATIPSISPASQTNSGATSPAVNSAQAAQIANLLGQLLGQQLRPLLNQGAASQPHDEPAIVPSRYQDQSFRNRYYRG